MGIANTMMETYYEVKAELAKAIGERDQLAEILTDCIAQIEYAYQDTSTLPDDHSGKAIVKAARAALAKLK